MRFVRKPREVEVSVYRKGEKTKEEWLEKIPGANIGTVVGGDPRDFHWFVIPTTEGYLPIEDGDVIIQDVVLGVFYPPMLPIDFANEYEQKVYE